MKKRSVGALVLIFLALWGCGSPSPVQQTQQQKVDRNSITISPTSATVGSADLKLTIKGSGFADRRHFFSQAMWSTNGSNTALPTTFVSSTQLNAIVPADLLASPVTAQVFVQTGDPMGDAPPAMSGSIAFSVSRAAPGAAVIAAISPTSASVGSPDIVVTITGTNFDSQRLHMSLVGWSTAPGAPHCCITWLLTTFVSSSELTAVIPASLLINPGTAEVFVETGDIQGISDGVSYPKSNSLTFSVDP